MKIRCSKCSVPATWYYMPGDDDCDDYYCDACIARGCSCQTPILSIDDDGINAVYGEPDRDEMGRELPCCEYGFSEEGYDDESPMNPSDNWAEYEDE